VVEILINTPLCGDLIRKGEVHQLKELMAKSGEQGMITFDQALFALVQQNEISYQEAIKHADSANELRLMVKLKGDPESARELQQSLDKISLVETDDRPEPSTTLVQQTTMPPPETEPPPKSRIHPDKVPHDKAPHDRGPKLKL